MYKVCKHTNSVLQMDRNNLVSSDKHIQQPTVSHGGTAKIVLLLLVEMLKRPAVTWIVGCNNYMRSSVSSGAVVFVDGGCVHRCSK